jgi:hypothetical protein
LLIRPKSDKTLKLLLEKGYNIYIVNYLLFFDVNFFS